MGKIVTIGGEIGRPKKDGGFYPVETTAIDKEIIRLSGKEDPLHGALSRNIWDRNRQLQASQGPLQIFA